MWVTTDRSPAHCPTTTRLQSWPWDQVLHRWSNRNGALDDAEPVITAPSVLIVKQTLCLLNKQFVPAGIAPGAQSTTTLSASYTTASAMVLLSAVDVTTVTDSSALDLTKRVSNFTRDSASGITVSAKPDETLQYTLSGVDDLGRGMRAFARNVLQLGSFLF